MERPILGPYDAHSAALHCCCGRLDCALLKKNSSILETVEKDVHTAAQLGQALLARHEAYMADAERGRLDLNARIERLEMAKQELEAENAIKIEENRNLLDQLEVLNNTVSESDTRIKSLEASLLSSQQSVRRLEAAAIRAADAERHLAILEHEQEQLHLELQSTKEDSRSHARRFNEAQRGILDMQDQLERMESETRQEQERHVEIIERMERQREVEKHLDTAAGRLKGAAATKSLQDQKNGSTVVNHFVRDLLQDNANLQLGIAELREMLYNSNDEIQSLREQLMYHQPMLEESSTASTLKAELETQTPKVSQELHIHHHYHVAPKTETRKLRRKRPGLTSGAFTPPVLTSPATPASAGQWQLTSSPTAPALLSLSSKQQASIMSTPRHSWSMASDHPSEFASSVPSSPRTNQRDSMFDLTFMDSDLPTSPSTSLDPTSPTWRAHRKGPSEISALSFQAPSLQIEPGTPPTPQASRQRRYEEDTIREEDEDAEELPRLETPDLVATAPSIDESSTIEGSDVSRDEIMFRPRLHRALSHESIMSLTGGLDIHTLKARPSQLTLRPLGGAEAVVTGVTAQPTLSRGSAKRSAMALRDSFAGLPGSRAVSSPMARSLSPGPSDSQGNSSGPLGKWVGWRPWGGSGALAGPSTSTGNATLKPPDKDQERDWNRAPGINQPGAIPGFQKYWAAQRRKGAPAKVTTETIDHKALAEGLQE
ncbi:Fc.00g103550.m01.CDS01 [Cosmosporella sp. VM-42]